MDTPITIEAQQCLTEGIAEQLAMPKGGDIEFEVTELSGQLFKAVDLS